MTTKSERIAIRVDNKTKEQIELLAKKENRSMSNFIENIIIEKLEEKDMTNFRNVRNMEIELSGSIFKVNKNNDFYTLENKWGKKVGALVDLGTTADYTFGELQEIIKRETEINTDYWVAAKQYGRWLVVEAIDDVKLFAAKELDEIVEIEASSYTDWWIDDLYIKEELDYFTVAKGSTVLGKIWKGAAEDVADMKIAFFHGDNPVYEEWEDGCGNVLSYEGWGK